MNKLHASVLAASFLVAGSFVTYASPAYASAPEKTSVTTSQPSAAHEFTRNEGNQISVRESRESTDGLGDWLRKIFGGGKDGGGHGGGGGGGW